MLATARLKLRKFVRADAPRVAEICADYRVSSMCRVVPHPYTEADALAFIEHNCNALDALILAVVLLADDTLIGCISLEEFRPDFGGSSLGGTVADLGYFLTVDAWGFGYATEAASAIVDHAFGSRGLSAIESGHWAENDRSSRVQAKLGLTPVRRELLYCAARAAELEQVCTRLERANWEAAKAAPLPPPLVLRGLLTDEDLRQIHSHAHQLELRREHAGDGVAFGARYGEGHEALFLHYVGGSPPLNDGASQRGFVQACANVFQRLRAAIREAAATGGLCGADAFDSLSVRCIEYHTYTAGGGVTEKGHRDAGSCLTLSVLLTEPCEGGVFSTTDAGGVTTPHVVGRGDGILLCSEMLHNVSTLRGGERKSLVIEWWSRKANSRDRFS
jgi:[ribosomal protein S5]-alanine N-acetyltransferase